MRAYLSILMGAAVLCAIAGVSVPDARGAVLFGGSPVRGVPPLSASRNSLESAAAKAEGTGRAVAMSLIGLAFAAAAIVLAFRRDFKEAVGAFALGLIAVVFATPAGVHVLRDTVTTLFGSS